MRKPTSGRSLFEKKEGKQMRQTSKQESEPDLTEPEAIRRAQSGDAAAFEHLYRSHSKHVYSVCMRMLKNTADAEDMTQQVFLQMFRRIGTFRGESGFSTWLHRVTVNAVLMQLRRRKPTENFVHDSDATGTGIDDPRELGRGDISMLGAIDRLNLNRAIHRLPSGYKRFFLLHHVAGFKHCEIAKLLKCTVGCSKSQAHRARKKLQHLLLGTPVQAEG
jgi:RNA polymerase sigma-70 factor (ECF subfamily)